MQQRVSEYTYEVVKSWSFWTFMEKDLDVEEAIVDLLSNWKKKFKNKNYSSQNGWTSENPEQHEKKSGDIIFQRLRK